MPRRNRDTNLGTKTARARLKARHKPFYRLISVGCHLGYRKVSRGAGTWLVRKYDGVGGYAVENLRAPDGNLIVADDYDTADGVHVMTFEQAQKKASGVRRSRSGPYTVNDALDDYIKMLEGEGRSRHSIQDTIHRIDAHVRSQLGKLNTAALTTERLRDWRDELAKVPARLRTRNGDQQKYHGPRDDADRKRRASANRVRTILLAALNHAYHDRKIDSDDAWDRLKPYKGVSAARVRYLSVDEARRLINACAADFRSLVQAALQTGCRYGELTRMQVHDFNPTARTVTVGKSKTGASRHVILTDEGAALFADLTAGRAGDAPIFVRSNGDPWGESHQLRRMAEAVKAARITPAVSFHHLRHTWASLSIMANVPLMVVARNLGHSDTRMVEKHYGHLSSSYIADAIRQGAPSFGYVSDNKVATIR